MGEVARICRRPQLHGGRLCWLGGHCLLVEGSGLTVYWAAAVAGKGKRRLLKEDHVKAEILSFHVYG